MAPLLFPVALCGLTSAWADKPPAMAIGASLSRELIISPEVEKNIFILKTLSME
ncbi:hypothetical protein ACET6L_00500 [Aeromonas rivipollensis]